MKKQIGMALVGVVLAIGALVGCSPPPEPKFDASRAEESLHEMGMYLSEHKKWSTFRFSCRQESSREQSSCSNRKIRDLQQLYSTTNYRNNGKEIFQTMR